MITLARAEARRLRAAFRRHALGLAPRGPAPPLVLAAGPDGLRVRLHGPDLAVECLLPGRRDPAGPVALPLDALAEVEGRDAAPVDVEAVAPRRTVARWVDRGIPRSREHDVPPIADLPAFPEPPARSEACPATLLDALAEAFDVGMEGSTRYDLDCVQLRGDSGEVIATDGHQCAVRCGFRFPWPGDLLVRRAAIFGGHALPREGSVTIGRTPTHVVLRVGAFTLFLAIRAEARFPRVDGIVPTGRDVATTLRLDPADARFLADALGRLPGGDSADAPVTLDLNGAVAVRARGDGGPATELVLARSRYEGAPVCVATNRAYLARALDPVPAELLCGAERALAVRGPDRTYVWQPLSKDAAWGPTEGAVRLSSGDAVASAATDGSPRQAAAKVAPGPRRNPLLPTTWPASPAAPAVAASTSSAPGLATLIVEAEALHALFADARSRTRALAAGLRRQRAHDRRVRDTLRSLGALKLQGVVD